MSYAQITCYKKIIEHCRLQHFRRLLFSGVSVKDKNITSQYRKLANTLHCGTVEVSK